MKLAWIYAFLFAMIIAELFALRYSRKEKIDWRDVIFNLNSGHIVLWLIRGLLISVYHFVLTNASLHAFSGLPTWLIWVFTFVSWDFCYYWSHRIHHYFSFLWAVHVVHHQGEHYNLSLGLRNSWYAPLTAFPFYAIFPVLGVPLEIYLACTGIHYLIQFYNHNDLVRRQGWLSGVLVNPVHHRLHHGKNPEYLDTNFGGTFIVWDKLFGTFQRKLEGVEIELGVQEQQRSYNALIENHIYFLRRFFPRLFRPTKSSNRLQVPDFLTAVGGGLLFVLLLYYIEHEVLWTSGQRLFFFGLLLISVAAIGGLSDGRRWAWIVWAVTFNLLVPLLLFWLKGSIDIFLQVILALLFIHGLLLSWFLLRSSVHSRKIKELA